jgi:N-acetylglucosamine-6-phosphate deacetylase
VRTYLYGGILLTPEGPRRDSTLVIEQGKIAALVPGRKTPGRSEQEIDARGLWASPGLIDLHVHGAVGHDTMDATPQALHGMARFFARHGVTAYLATTLTAPAEHIHRAIENGRTAPQPEDGAQHLGIHLEGPYLSAAYCGAQPAAFLRPPDPTEYEGWLASGAIRLMTLAPESEGSLALVERCARAGVESAVGHSAASYEQVQAAADRGLRQASHTFNGMPPLHHRTPGVLGAVLSDERIYAQVIADGVHVHPAAVRLLVRAKGPGRTILITDSIRAAGLADGQYDLGGQVVSVRQGVARTERGTLAGSTLTLDQAVRNAMRFTGLPLHQVLPMATSVPAQAMGWGERRGALAPGAEADIILLDEKLAVCLTMVAGRVVYRRQSPE